MTGILLSEGIGPFEFLDRIRADDGLPALALMAVLWFFCHLLYHLVWKVWYAAMTGKDREIARLTKELERYQSLVFERLLGPDDLVILTHKGWPDDDGGGGNSSQDKVH